MKLKVLKLGTECRDKATDLRGTLTHWIINMSERVIYIFQPKGLDDNGQPVKKLLLEEKRLEIKESDFETVEIPFEILGSNVTDKPSGFTGMGIEFVRHINGCFHVVIQPKGISSKTKMPIESCDFDLRQCTGKKIVEMSEEKLKESKKKRPSPAGDYIRRKLPNLS